MPNEIISKIQLPNEKTYDLKDEEAKRLQTAITSPTANGEAFSFIDTISQNTQGVISATKKTIPDASTTTKGLFSSVDKIRLNNTLSASEIESAIEQSAEDVIDDIATRINITSTDTTWANIYNKLSKLPNRGTATLFIMNTTATSLLTDGKIANVMAGMVVQSNTGIYEFMMKQINSQYIYIWRIEGLTNADATPTIKPVYKFSDTDQLMATLHLNFSGSDNTWDKIYNIVSSMSDSTNAMFTANGAAVSVLTDGKQSVLLKGLISCVNHDTGVYDFIAYTGYRPQYIWIWRISGLSSASATPTIGTVAQYVASTDGIMSITCGGTGANTASAARTNLSVYSKSETDTAIAQSTAKTQAIVINDSQTTWSAIYAKLKDGLNDAGGGRVVALITVYNTAATNILSGGNISIFFKGYVTLSGANGNLYDFFGGSLSSGDMYAWRVTASDSGPTISNFRSYADYEKSTAWTNNWLTNTSILAYAASVANPSFTTFRTNATSTDVPIANEYYIGTVERYGQNITVKMNTMQDASKMYINNSTNGGSTWTGWKTFVNSISLIEDDNTIAKIAEKLLALPNAQTATFFANATPAKLLSTNGSTTNPKIAESMYGTVNRIGSNVIRIIFRLSGNTRLYAMSATVTTSSITTDSIYYFTGTAL